MSAYAGPEIVEDGLGLCLDPANPKSYPGTGTTWFDLSGNGNDAVITNAPVFSDGVVTLTGTQWATVPTNGTGSLDFKTAQTVSIWMYHTFTSGRRNPWDQAYGGYGTWTHEAGNFINCYWGSNGGNAQSYTSRSSGTTPRGVWNNMVFVRNAANATWYKNGVVTSSGTNPYGVLPNTTTADIRIGRGYAGYWIGQMGPVMAYTKALTAEEVQQNFNAIRGRYGV